MNTTESYDKPNEKGDNCEQINNLDQISGVLADSQQNKPNVECPRSDAKESENNLFVTNETNNNNKNNPNVRVVEQLKGLAEAFARRGEEVKRRISQPIQTSSPEESVVSELPSSIYEEEWMTNMDITQAIQMKKSAIKEFWYKLKHRELGAFEPQSAIYISWLFIVSLAFVYNSVIIVLRSVFPYETQENRHIFFIFDYLCDILYAMDIIWFKMRLKYVSNGQWIDDPLLTRSHYMKQKRFKIDLLSLLPLDVFYLKYGFDKPLLRLLRLNRIFKMQTFWEFFSRIDAITKYPYFIRIIHTLIYKIYLIHLNTCAYYLMSWYQGFGSTSWTYNNQGNAYLRCFYFAFRTATSIGGRMPKPTNDLERVYMIFSWLMGVFVFALLIGQIRDIVATATQNKTHYRDIMNKTVRYMRDLCLPHDLQKRVRLWLTYTWEQQKTFDENKILELLPLKMQTDLALSIHYHTLSRVELFKDCERTLLRDLVLKFRSVLYLPGDYVCKKGQIGHEMYIVNKGQVCVMDVKDSKKILATLSEGSVFGEISILGISGFNRRTADVRSLGYSNLFVLSKADLMETLKNYPEYKENLLQKVRKLLKCREKVRESPKLDEIDVKSIVTPVKRPSTPRLLHTVMQMVSPDSRVSQMLSRSPRSSLTSLKSMTPSATSSATHFQFPSTEKILSPDSSVEIQQSMDETYVEVIDRPDSAVDNKIINDIVYEL